MQDPASGLSRIPLPRTPVNRPYATLKPLDASRALRPTRARSLLPPPTFLPYGVVGAPWELLVVCDGAGVAVVLGVGLVH